MKKKLPYGKQTIDEDDIKAVTKALKNEIISGCGPITTEFEKIFEFYKCKILSHVRWNICITFVINCPRNRT